jgi:hypothetical protein
VGCSVVVQQFTFISSQGWEKDFHLGKGSFDAKHSTTSTICLREVSKEKINLWTLMRLMFIGRESRLTLAE